MKVNHNTRLDLDVLHVTLKEFPTIYESLLLDTEVDIKLARLNITNLDEIELYIFRRSMDVKTVSALGLKPNEMSITSRLIYKWLAPTLQELRYTVEKAMGIAFDWTNSADRNSMMYESAVPLAQLYSPILHIDDTFILQEYFIPRSCFQKWIDFVKPIYYDINKNALVSLLNTTIRFVYENENLLSYSKHKEGSYAFVLYFRISRTKEADDELKKFHFRFVEIALKLRGSFYLPYRHHYSLQQLETAYGKDILERFLSEKEKYDPNCVFSSLWLRNYGSHFASENYRDKIFKVNASQSWSTKVNDKKKYEIKMKSEHRSESYHKLWKNHLQRRKFLEHFLTKVFHVEDPSNLNQIISRTIWDPKNRAEDIYVYIQSELAKYVFSRLF